MPIGSVTWSGEFRRIEALPRRRWEDDPQADHYRLELERVLLHDPEPCGPACNCPVSLWPAQVAALIDIVEQKGALLPLGCGRGKALISLLAPTLLLAKRPLLLVPSKLRGPTRDIIYPALARHWRLHPTLEVRGFSELSTARNVDLLDRISPDVIVVDECHSFKAKKAGRTRRLGRYLKEREMPIVLVLMSGTLVSKSIRDMAHLSEWSLGQGSPMPINWREAEEWSCALDDDQRDDHVVMPGALMRFCNEGEEAIDGFRRRLLETPGVVGADGIDGVKASLTISVTKGPTVPPKILTAMAKLRDSWELPDGRPIMERVELWRHMRELAQGFWSHWQPPPPRDWLQARRAWGTYVREVLRTNRRKLDTEDQVRAECAAMPDPPIEYIEWTAIKDSFKPVSVPVWVDDFAVDAAARWLDESPGIVWVERVPFGERLRDKHGVRYFGAGEDEGIAILKASGPIAASVQAHGEGRNLQYQWSRNLCPAPWPGGKVWEQCLDAQTEILTNEGWVGIDRMWTDELRVAAYDIDDGSVRWERGIRVERLLGQEKMFGIVNPHLDIRVTAGHRMIHEGIRRFGGGGCDGFAYTDRRFVEAQHVPQRGRIPINGLQTAPGVPLTDDELVFIGLFMTDGNLSAGNNSISLFQAECHPEIMALIEKTVIACGFKFRHSIMSPKGAVTNYGVRQHALHRWAISKGAPKKDQKHLRGWGALADYLDKNCALALEDMSVTQLRVLLKGMWAGNGLKTKGSHPYNRYEAGTLSICTPRKLAAERLQSLCVRRGMRCSITAQTDKLWMMHISEDRVWSLLANMKLKRPVWGILPSDPSERMWCVEVDSGAIITRRNGKVAVVGNCVARTHRFGQPADEVVWDVWCHAPELVDAWEAAKASARWIEKTLGGRQKMNYANVVEES